MQLRVEGPLAWAAYFLIGTGLLAPWNALLIGIDYFAAVFPGKPMDRLFTVTYLPACLSVLLLLLRFKITFLTPYVRIVNSFIGFALIMLVIPMLDLFGLGPRPPSASEDNSSTFFPAVLSATIVIGALDGLCQGAVFADVAALPPKFTQAVVSGTACSGFLVSVLRISSKALWAEEQRDTGFPGLQASTELYFLAAALLSLACAAAYGLLLPNLRAVQQLRRVEEQESLLLSLHSKRSCEVEHDLRQAAAPAQAEQRVSLFRSCWKRLWPLCSGLLITYIVTLSIFPGFLAEDVENKVLGDWYPILLISAFNTADLVGKLLPASSQSWRKGPTGHSRFHLQRIAHAWLLFAMSRVLFIPAFICAAFVATPPVIMFLLTILLGASNGLVTAGLMLGGPEMLDPGMEDAGEGILVISLISGLLVGALAGFLWLL
ncbi:nucleoside transporter-domain-containing protein [Dunaliella salina]|uniref:Nucleoside transporter-domain-containing protein n=1 Tax=Dunaliella salina TaxID=3046 RepID=A0ABQ7H5Z2_DUNSA|nr:nucleoside transporter-domain-containing protein [Dunaliella salina]|eukprot:KAF5842221.1 nucleoside transporter-domain-containing protein [Dunaliella salina]